MSKLSKKGVYTLYKAFATLIVIATIGTGVIRSNAQKAPLATTDHYSTRPNTILTLNPLLGDYDIESENITVNSINGINITLGTAQNIPVTGGIISKTASEVFSFVSEYGFSGTTNIPYTIVDESGNISSSQAYESITVQNQNPITSDENYSTPSNTPIIINPISGDMDPDGDSITLDSIEYQTITPGISQSIPTTNGTVSTDSSGIITYTPTSGTNGVDFFVYTVKDVYGGISGTGFITIYINNSSPITTQKVFSTNQNQSIPINIITGDYDPDGDVITVNKIDTTAFVAGTSQVFGTAFGGTLTSDTLGNITYEPNVGFVGVDGFEYQTKDDSGNTSNFSAINIEVTQDGSPIPQLDNYIVVPNTPVAINLLANDTDPNGQNLTLKSINFNNITGGAQTITNSEGDFVIDSSNNISFVPSSNFVGAVSFPYTVTNTSNQVSTSAVVFRDSPNHFPIAKPDSYSYNSIITPLANDTDFDNDPLTLLSIDSVNLTGSTQSIPTLNGTINVSSTNVITYSRNPGFVGTEYFVYEIKDSTGKIANSSISLYTPPNLIPSANPDYYTTQFGKTKIISPIINDTDPDGDSLAIISINGVNLTGTDQSINVPNGTININSSGLISYVPSSNHFGVSGFEYTIKDVNDKQSTGSISIITTKSQNPQVPIVRSKPSVSINQKSTQLDPTNNQILVFEAIFSEPIDVSSFGIDDIVLTGTATDKVVSSISQVSPNNATKFEIIISATGDGSVIANIPTATFGYNSSVLSSSAGALDIIKDSKGNVYTTNYFGSTVTKTNPQGISSQIQTLGSIPYGLAIDSNDNVYVTNSSSNNVSKITPLGVASIIGTTGQFPTHIVVNSLGEIYTSNYTSNNITKIIPNISSTNLSYNGSAPFRMVIDSQDNIFVTNYLSNNVSKIDSNDVVSMYGSTGSKPWDLAFGPSGDLYVTNSESNSLTKISAFGVSTTPFASTGNVPRGIAVDSLGNIFVSNYSAGTITKIDTTNAASVFGTAGSGPYYLHIDENDSIYVTEFLGSNIRLFQNQVLTGIKDTTGAGNTAGTFVDNRVTIDSTIVNSSSSSVAPSSSSIASSSLVSSSSIAPSSSSIASSSLVSSSSSETSSSLDSSSSQNSSIDCSIIVPLAPECPNTSSSSSIAASSEVSSSSQNVSSSSSEVSSSSSETSSSFVSSSSIAPSSSSIAASSEVSSSSSDSISSLVSSSIVSSSIASSSEVSSSSQNISSSSLVSSSSSITSSSEVSSSSSETSSSLISSSSQNSSTDCAIIVPLAPECPSTSSSSSNAPSSSSSLSSSSQNVSSSSIASSLIASSSSIASSLISSSLVLSSSIAPSSSSIASSSIASSSLISSSSSNAPSPSSSSSITSSSLVSSSSSQTSSSLVSSSSQNSSIDCAIIIPLAPECPNISSSSSITSSSQSVTSSSSEVSSSSSETSSSLISSSSIAPSSSSIAASSEVSSSSQNVSSSSSSLSSSSQNVSSSSIASSLIASSSSIASPLISSSLVLSSSIAPSSSSIASSSIASSSLISSSSSNAPSPSSSLSSSSQNVSSSSLVSSSSQNSSSSATNNSNLPSITTENNSPNNGDGNGDGVLDSLQDNVVSIPTIIGSSFLTAEFSGELGTCSKPNYVRSINPTTTDSNYDYPFGIVDFGITCNGTTNVKLYWHGISDINFEQFAIRKLGNSVPGNNSTQRWFSPNVAVGSQLIGNKRVAMFTYSITDGQTGDDTAKDGTIIDPIGPAKLNIIATSALNIFGNNNSNPTVQSTPSLVAASQVPDSTKAYNTSDNPNALQSLASIILPRTGSLNITGILNLGSTFSVIVILAYLQVRKIKD